MDGWVHFLSSEKCPLTQPSMIIHSRNWDQFNDRHGLLSLFFFKAVSDIELDPRRENPKGNKEIWESREMS